jgi:hypothetical protein
MALETQRLSAYTRFASSTAALLALAACAASSPLGGRTQGSVPAPAQSGVMADASYDWHGLVLAPFGTLLRDTPIALHEVLLFHDESQGVGAAVDAKDCYAGDAAPPRFVGRQPDEYLLCFDHDHLTRIDASVRLAVAEATPVFERACALWLKNSVPAAGIGDTCEGRDGGIAFSARLGLVPGEPTASLLLTLTAAAERDAEHVAVGDAVDAAAREK